MTIPQKLRDDLDRHKVKVPYGDSESYSDLLRRLLVESDELKKLKLQESRKLKGGKKG